MDLYKWQMQRELMWITYISPHQDPKKMAKRKDLLLPLNGDKRSSLGVSEEHKQLFLKEFEKYQQAVNKNT